MQVRYFAWVRERTGCGSETVDGDDRVRTVSALADMLAARSAGHALVFADRSTLRVAVNREQAGFDTAINRDDEIAFFPPMTGG